MGGNTFYTNAEAYAMEILQQKMMKEAQRSAQQTLMELAAMRSFLGQGQLIYCIPFGGATVPAVPAVPFSFPVCPLPSQDSSLGSSLSSSTGSSSSSTPSSTCSSDTSSSSTSSQNHHRNDQSVVHVNVKNNQAKIPPFKTGPDECNLGKDGIEVTIDLREYLPAEISVDVEEKSVEIKASHVDSQGCKTFARRYDLPACIVLESVKTILTHDGYLLFSAAWCKME